MAVNGRSHASQHQAVVGRGDSRWSEWRLCKVLQPYSPRAAARTSPATASPRLVLAVSTHKWHFRRAVQATAEETVAFSWIEWPDKATRDAAMKKIMEEPRRDPSTPGNPPLPFDGNRMIFGGFAPVVEVKARVVQHGPLYGMPSHVDTLVGRAFRHHFAGLVDGPLKQKSP
ncbi:MAG: DUF1428 family protein [Chitinophagaceae bacterium]|nr:DUF1428 family protein [Rubrivivax sp.]